MIPLIKSKSLWLGGLTKAIFALFDEILLQLFQYLCQFFESHLFQTACLWKWGLVLILKLGKCQNLQ